MKTFIKLPLIVVLLLATTSLSAQMQNYEFGFCIRKKKTVPSDPDPTGVWHMEQKLLGITMRGHVSLIDLLINGDGDNKFRFGEYLGASFCTGYAKEKINPNGPIGGPDTRQIGTMWMSIDLQAGLQASYALNDDLRVGLNGFFEFQFGFVAGTDYNENIYSYKFVGGNVRYGRLYLEYNHGLPWDMTDDEDYDDHISRFHFRLFTNVDKGKNIGLRLESGRRKWYSGRTDRLTTFELSFGRMF